MKVLISYLDSRSSIHKMLGVVSFPSQFKLEIFSSKNGGCSRIVGIMEDDKATNRWVGDQLMNLLGYNTPTIVSFVIGLGTHSANPTKSEREHL